MSNNTTAFNSDALVKQLTPLFNMNSTVRTIATYLIVNYPDLTHDQMATVVQGIKNEFGQMANTSGSSIAWYKQDMKKKGGNEETKSAFTAYLRTVSQKEQNEILLKLATKHIDTLVKVADIDEISKYVPIKDTSETKPNAAQIAAARENAGEAPKVVDLPTTSKKLKKINK